VLVTLKLGQHVWNLRTRRAFERLLPRLAAARERLGMRLVHFSVQRDHIHLLVEACDTMALSRGIQGLSVRIARALNRMMHRRGKVFADRFHHRVLTTPRQVRNALAYVLCNARKHGHAPWKHDWLDPYSSAPAFDGWRSLDRDDDCVAALIIVNARTWLLAIGWRRGGGSIDPDHCPGASWMDTPAKRSNF
jgi:REP element-mobilizing transposase RayT